MQVTAQQQINFLQQLQKNADSIIANTNYVQNYNISEDCNDDLYSAALTVTACNMLNINTSTMQAILDTLQFTCSINTTLVDTMRYLLHVANINDLIDEINYTYSV